MTEPRKTSTAAPARIPDGTDVVFTFGGQTLSGTIVDAITFNSKVRHGVRTADGRTYDVWPDMDIQVVR